MCVRVMIRCEGAARARRRNSRGALGVEHPYPHPHRWFGRVNGGVGREFGVALTIFSAVKLCVWRPSSAFRTAAHAAALTRNIEPGACPVPRSHHASSASCRAPTPSPCPNHLPFHPHTSPTSGRREELSCGTRRNPHGGNALAPPLTLCVGDARVPFHNSSGLPPHCTPPPTSCTRRR